MMTTLFDEETVLKAAFAEKDREKAEAREAGRLEGILEGEKRGEKRGEERGEKRGEKRGEENSRLLILGHMVKNSGFTIEKALEISGIPKDEWDKYISKFS